MINDLAEFFDTIFLSFERVRVKFPYKIRLEHNWSEDWPTEDREQSSISAYMH